MTFKIRLVFFQYIISQALFTFFEYILKGFMNLKNDEQEIKKRE